MKRRLCLVLTFLLLAFLCASCSASADENNYAPPADSVEKESMLRMESQSGQDPESAPAPDAGGFSYEAETGEGSADVTLAVDPNRKLIRTGDLRVETLEFERSLSVLNTLVGTCGGYVDSSNVTGVSKTSYGQERLRTATYTVRIPSAQFEAFLNHSGELGNVLSRSSGSTDVTDQYFDTEAHLKTLEMERLMLQEEFDKSTKMSDRITLLDKLRNVQYEIEKLTGTLRKYDGLVEYSTITVLIEEVVVISDAEPVAPDPKTLGQRISQRFSDTMVSLRTGGSNFLVWFIGALPFLLIWGIIIFVAVIVIRKIIKRALAAAADRPINAYPPSVFSPPPPPQSKETPPETPESSPEAGNTPDD